MAIEDNNPVDEIYTNSRLLSKLRDEIISGVITLNHDNLISGATIPDLQKCLNDLKELLLILTGVTSPIGLVSSGAVDQTIEGRKDFVEGIYFGEPDTDDTWRVRQSGTDLVFEVRVAGTYEERTKYEA